MQLEACPEAGLCVIQQLWSGGSRLTHTATFDFVDLAGGCNEWDLACDGDGVAFVYSMSDEHEPRVVHELFGFAMFASGSGELFVAYEQEEQDAKIFPLRTLLADHSLGHVTLQAGFPQTSSEFSVACFSKSYPGGRFMWSLVDLHSLLGLAESRGSANLPGCSGPNRSMPLGDRLLGNTPARLADRSQVRRILLRP